MDGQGFRDRSEGTLGDPAEDLRADLSRMNASRTIAATAMAVTTRLRSAKRVRLKSRPSSIATRATSRRG
jgi:hypothetical protein